MGVIYILIIVSLFVAIVFLGVFFLAVKNGQFEDSETPAMRILFNDVVARKKE
ncbi:cbb3-type cytochrome oxidase assembly protein CcoS [Wenyingzhuangia aestuarii]|uniref:cbb3-type cytochrome oxidase assembly protein CcoS n=1 Tax=Wenyingzhuangia aestuarii TaxID=1647582 RepID=UPI001438EA09|nr:cbb3-type cytochrome oxidase assembly protein CcoS [Wenyingzhuangia aestuarii]NJB81851.1 cbb3-type cytochrome oxidase maturation protein [Wenyingzhuangia aestuarii]